MKVQELYYKNYFNLEVKKVVDEVWQENPFTVDERRHSFSSTISWIINKVKKLLVWLTWLLISLWFLVGLLKINIVRQDFVEILMQPWRIIGAILSGRLFTQGRVFITLFRRGNSLKQKIYQYLAKNVGKKLK